CQLRQDNEVVRFYATTLPAPHAEHRCRPDADRIKLVGLRIIAGDVLVEQLTRTVHRVWSWRVVLAQFRTGEGCTPRVHGYGTHVDHPGDAGKPGRLEHIGGADAVDPDRRQRIAYPAGAEEISQMDNALDVVFFDRVDKGGGFQHISRHHLHLCGYVSNGGEIGGAVE